jgi:hypothetical protein
MAPLNLDRVKQLFNLGAPPMVAFRQAIREGGRINPPNISADATATRDPGDLDSARQTRAEPASMPLA